MNELTREEGVARKPMISGPIALPGFEGKTLRVRELTLHERNDMDRRRFIFGEESEGATFVEESDAAAWIVACACDEAGKRLFTWDDFEAVKAWPARDQNRVVKAARELNLIDDDAVKAEAKNSSASP